MHGQIPLFDLFGVEPHDPVEHPIDALDYGVHLCVECRFVCRGYFGVLLCSHPSQVDRVTGKARVYARGLRREMKCSMFEQAGYVPSGAMADALSKPDLRYAGLPMHARAVLDDMRSETGASAPQPEGSKQ